MDDSHNYLVLPVYSPTMADDTDLLSVSELCFSSPFIAFDIPGLYGASDARTICMNDPSAPSGLCPFVYAPKHATKATRSKLVLFS